MARKKNKGRTNAPIEEPTGDLENVGETDVTEPQEPAGSVSDDDKATLDEGLTGGEPEVPKADLEPEPDEAKNPEATAPLEELVASEEQRVDDSADKQEVETAKKATSIEENDTSGVGMSTLVFACLFAGLLGGAAAYFFVSQQLSPQIDAVKERVAIVEETPAETIDIPDIAPLQNQLDAISSNLEGLTAQSSANTAAITDLIKIVDELQTAGVTGNLPEGATEAYEQELETARAFIRAQRAEIEDLIEEARSVEDEADAAANAAIRRAALSRILSAIDSGESFSGAVGDLQASGIEVPSGLAEHASNGVPSMSDLQNSFPLVARKALSSSRSVTGNEGGLTGFLRSQLGARSLEPKEGGDPDAVLSRAEAALRDGRMNDVLAEIDGLPEEGKAELLDWSDQLTQRLSAVQAAQELSESLN
ncbi:MAG: hypothetical protein AAF066_00535 [Pseudomonadota bacterium]